jgi:hypothetical protein
MKQRYSLVPRILFCTAILCCNGAFAAKGGNKPPAAPSAQIDSVVVDRVNQVIVVTGSNLSGATFSLGGVSVAASTTDSSAGIGFSEVADIVDIAGNYSLVVGGGSAYSVYIDGDIVDPGLSGCPCATDWDTDLSGRNWSDAGCIEIGTEIAGYINDDDSGNTLVIGAVYQDTNPNGSVCSLTEIDGSTAFPTTLVEYPVNEIQQTACATDIKNKLPSCTP